MELLELLKYRFSVAENYTKPFQEEVKKCLEDYSIDTNDSEITDLTLSVNKRYEFKIPYIFATHESMMASMFDRIPDLIFKGRGKLDKYKQQKVEAAYEYLKDVSNLESFMNDSAWWFILTGFASAHAAFISETEEVPLLDENGEQMLDENNEPIMRTEYKFNDPVVSSGNPEKEYYSPESQFSYKADKVPYYFKTQLMEVEDIKNTYDVEVDADSSIDEKDDDSKRDDSKRAKVYMYYGTIPSDNKDDIEGWEYGSIYYVVYVANKIVYKQKITEKPCRLLKWHGAPTKFFGFGIGKSLRAFQKELSIRRGQQIRYGDIAAFPKIAMEEQSTTDPKALLDPRENVVLLYKEKPPTYLTAPDLSNTLVITEEKAREDAQFVSGMLDLAKGGQSSVVKTATGQSIFAEAAEKRMRQAKRKFGLYYREVVVLLLKLAQEHWDEEKVMAITDEDGQDVEVTFTKEDFADINFDTDIDIDIESISVNKDALRAQATELYDRTKDDPNVDGKAMFKKVLREGFDEKNPDNYVNDEQEAQDKLLSSAGGDAMPESQATAGAMGM